MITKNYNSNNMTGNVFIIPERGRKNPLVDYKRNNRKRMIISFISALSLIVIMTFVFNDYEFIPVTEGVPGAKVMTVTDIIPRTVQNVKRRPQPEKPAVPIEAEIEEMAEDVTIDFQEITFSDVPPMPGNSMTVPNLTTAPRMIRQVIPEISGNLKKKGVKGAIKVSAEVDTTGKITDIVILQSTVNSQEAEKAMIAAAYRALFLPAKAGKKKVKERTVFDIEIDFSK